jgi:hypothetical protein
LELLDIKIPSKTRMQFANLESKEIWSKKIEKAKNLYRTMEIDSVKYGLRRCAILHSIEPNDLQSWSQNLLKNGMIIVPLSKEGIDGNGFGHVSQGYRGGRYQYRSVIARTIEDAKLFVDAHERGDDIAIGELLGYPTCCSRFFNEVWQQGYVDPIWQQAERTSDVQITRNKKDFLDKLGNIEKKLIRFKKDEENWKIQQIFRYIGVRIVPHLPCSYNCKESIQMANKWIDLAREIKVEGLDEALEIMKLPSEWDALKGVAEIRTPVFKIATTSVACFPNHVVQQESDYYPDEAPNGIQFPWKVKNKILEIKKREEEENDKTRTL